MRRMQRNLDRFGVGDHAAGKVHVIRQRAQIVIAGEQEGRCIRGEGAPVGEFPSSAVSTSPDRCARRSAGRRADASAMRSILASSSMKDSSLIADFCVDQCLLVLRALDEFDFRVGQPVELIDDLVDQRVGAGERSLIGSSVSSDAAYSRSISASMLDSATPKRLRFWCRR